MRIACRRFRQYGLWPALIAAAIAVTHLGMVQGWGFLAFNTAYLGLAAALFAAERLWPHERRWLASDGQIGADLAHTVLNKSVAQVLLAVGAVFGAAELVRDGGLHGVWPAHWPLAAQVALALVLAEAGLYAAHRLAHEWPLLWRFHAVHHSSTRLSFLNTGRFHVVDTAASILLSQPILFLAGAPVDVFKWVSAITAFVGMLTHCNVDMRFGWLNYLVNTPTLHRFHHARDVRIGNRNYGENLMLFDLLLGTHYYRRWRPSAEIGIDEPMPPGFLAQLAHPFRRRRGGGQPGGSSQVPPASGRPVGRAAAGSVT